MLSGKQELSEGSMSFTNKNSRYETNVNKGHPHGIEPQGGSVFKEPIFIDGDSLWLEHVIDIKTGRDDLYWLMWYDAHGRPTTKVSGILSRDDLRVFSKNLASFLEIP